MNRCLAATATVLSLAIGTPSDTEAASLGFALAECSKMIADSLGASNAGAVPVVKNYGGRNEFYFAWPKGTMVIQTPMGDVPFSASCGGQLQPYRLDWVTINGKDMLPRK